MSGSAVPCCSRARRRRRRYRLFSQGRSRCHTATTCALGRHRRRCGCCRCSGISCRTTCCGTWPSRIGATDRGTPSDRPRTLELLALEDGRSALLRKFPGRRLGVQLAAHNAAVLQHFGDVRRVGHRGVQPDQRPFPENRVAAGPLGGSRVRGVRGYHLFGVGCDNNFVTGSVVLVSRQPATVMLRRWWTSRSVESDLAGPARRSVVSTGRLGAGVLGPTCGGRPDKELD